MSYDAVALGKLYGISPDHVIHVGAWEGLDVPEYLVLGAQKITLVEALPDKATALRTLYREEGRVEVIERAASNIENEVVTFYPLNYGSSSLLKPKIDSLKEIFADFTEFDEIDVRTIKVDNLSPDAWNAIFLVIDVQGAELKVLEGAIRTLKRTVLIKIEVSKTEYYENPTHPSDIEQFLRSQGFTKVSERINNRIGQGDAIYAPQGQINLSQNIHGKLLDLRWKISIQRINLHQVGSFFRSFGRSFRR